MNNDMIKMMRKVCYTFDVSMDLFDRTMEVYTFLRDNKDEFKPIEIAERLNYKYGIFDGVDDIAYMRVVRPLHLLEKMGLVSRNTYTKKVNINSYYPMRVKDVKIINGIEYVGYIEKETYEKEVTYYKWFAL